jgi:hypothetical protein
MARGWPTIRKDEAKHGLSLRNTFPIFPKNAFQQKTNFLKIFTF